MGVSRGQFIKLERGERKLTERTIDLAARAFGVSRGRVLGDDMLADGPETEQEEVFAAPTVLSGVVERINSRLQALGLTAARASSAAGKPNAIEDLQRAFEEGKPLDLPIATLNALAGPLKTTATWLLVGVGRAATETPPAGSGSSEVKQDIGEGIAGSAQEVDVEYVQANYAGIVEAGSFRTVEEFEADPDRGPDFVPKDPDFPFAKLVTFTVSGDSMNALKPDPIRPGARITCIDYEASISRLPFRNGMVVVVEQTKNGGHLRERSVKQIEINGDEIAFWPRSTNPKHQPIIVPRLQDQDDGRKVRIIAIVREITNKVRLR